MLFFCYFLISSLASGRTVCFIILFVSAHGLTGQSNGCSWCGNVYQPGTGYVLAACIRGVSVGVGHQGLS